ncbi:MAG: 2OG-Fe(II) oxygenase, partial [Bacteroidota bacterium]
HLGTIARVHDQLSYFFLVQQPDEGGELILYDAEWDETKEELAKDYQTAVNHVESQHAHVIDMRAGDLVVFAGGRVWHQVRDVSGNTNRVTLGGFMAYSHEMDKLYHWS